MTLYQEQLLKEVLEQLQQINARMEQIQNVQVNQQIYLMDEFKKLAIHPPIG